jgi:hypothetical protein
MGCMSTDWSAWEDQLAVTKMNLPVVRGDSLGVVIRLWEDVDKTVPSDLTGATATAQVRADPDGDLIGDFSVVVTGNEVSLNLLPAVSQLLPAMSRWDCQVDWASDGVSVQTVAYGSLAAMPDVTRPS